MLRTVLVILFLATAVGISALLSMGKTGTASQLEQVMSRHGLTAANIVYGRVQGEALHISVNAPPGIIMPYYRLAKPLTAAVALHKLGQLIWASEPHEGSLADPLQQRQCDEHQTKDERRAFARFAWRFGDEQTIRFQCGLDTAHRRVRILQKMK